MNCPTCGSEKPEKRFKVVKYNFLMACPDKFHGDTYAVPEDGNEVALRNFLNSLPWPTTP